MRWLSIKESLEEFAKLMNIQVDLRNEAENLLKFHHNFKVIHFIGSFFFCIVSVILGLEMKECSYFTLSLKERKMLIFSTT